jgi:hypothetical protein
MNERIPKRVELDDGQDHFHGHHLPWEMAKVAAFGGYRLLVWADDERASPHFHVVRGRNLLFPDFEACLEIRSAAYCPHGGKYADRLPEGDLEGLVALLASPDKCAGGKQTIWRSLLCIWNSNNDTRRIPVTTPMPDYRHPAGPIPEK